jgi:hypothetical protein
LNEPLGGREADALLRPVTTAILFFNKDIVVPFRWAQCRRLCESVSNASNQMVISLPTTSCHR